MSQRTISPRNLIVSAIHQYVANPGGGSYEEERTVCRMGDGKTKTFVDGDPDLEAFFANEVTYWQSKGFVPVKRDGTTVIAQPTCVRETDERI